MKKLFIISLILASALLFTSCSAATGLIADTTVKQTGVIGNPDIEDVETFTDFVIHTNKYAFYTGEYYYFFSQYLSQFISGRSEAELLSEFGFDTSKSLKNQTVKNKDVTWYDFFRDLTVDYMTEILLVCEEASASGAEYVKEARSYVDTVKAYMTSVASASDLTFAEYIYAMYGGNVQSQNYLNAIQFEKTYEFFREAKFNAFYAAVPTDAAEAYASSLEGEKDVTLSRNIFCVEIDDGKAGGEALLSEFLAGDRTVAALSALAGKNGYSFDELKNLTASSVSEKAVSDWLFAEGRAVGDAGLVYIENDGYYLIYYVSDGEAQYLLDARRALADKAVSDWVDSLAKKYEVVIDETKLGGLNA